MISSDFCHWGDRFHYTHYDSNQGEIYQSIKVYSLFNNQSLGLTFKLQALDHAGMDIIERLDPQGFTAYLKQYGNTICGRHPIGVFLNMVAEIRPSLTNGHTMDLKFLKYAQSSQVSRLRMRENSRKYVNCKVIKW